MFGSIRFHLVQGRSLALSSMQSKCSYLLLTLSPDFQMRVNNLPRLSFFLCGLFPSLSRFFSFQSYKPQHGSGFSGHGSAGFIFADEFEKSGRSVKHKHARKRLKGTSKNDEIQHFGERNWREKARSFTCKPKSFGLSFTRS